MTLHTTSVLTQKSEPRLNYWRRTVTTALAACKFRCK